MKPIELWQGDCLELMKDIPDGYVDLVLTDPPYGTVKNLGNSQIAKENGYRDYGWDEIIDTKKMFQEIARVLRPNGKAILFSQEPYTSHIITSQIPSLPFSYRAVWVKNVFGNKFTCNKAMVNLFEDVCVFSKQAYDDLKINPLRKYFLDEKQKCGNVDFRKILGNGMASHYFTSGTQFALPTRENYEKLQTTGCFTRDWDELKQIDEQFNERFRSVFNLWQGGKSKSNVLEYKKDNDGYHPTQKPVALLEDLIQTYSNKGNTVLDFTMGSGSTGVACVNTNRRFIGIELDEGYFNIAKKRIEEAANDLP